MIATNIRDPAGSTVAGVPSRRPRPADVAVVFAHGYLCLVPQVYWLGLCAVRRGLAGRGVAVVATRAPFAGGVEARAGRLAAVIDGLPQRRIVLVGHSMGGLDARWVASRRDPGRRIGHVLTLGTPHRGTPAAEWALRDPSLRALLLRLVDRGALRDLTPEGAARLAEAAPDRPDVAYRSLAGALDPADLPFQTRRLGERLLEEVGPNDGLVPVEAAAWGTAAWGTAAVPRPLAVDHFGLVGAVMGPPRWGAQLRRTRRALAALDRLLRRAVEEAGAAGG